MLNSEARAFGLLRIDFEVDGEEAVVPSSSLSRKPFREPKILLGLLDFLAREGRWASLRSVGGVPVVVLEDCMYAAGAASRVFVSTASVCEGSADDDHGSANLLFFLTSLDEAVFSVRRFGEVRGEGALDLKPNRLVRRERESVGELDMIGRWLWRRGATMSGIDDRLPLLQPQHEGNS